jgi:ATP-dependent RNA helicase DeaD
MRSDPISRADSPSFRDLSLGEALLRVLNDVGYESPSPIQAATIPHLLAGTDVVGQAQTGTGKTAAFALPILSLIDLQVSTPQALVLVPTRELAIQVAEAFQRYANYLEGFHVVPIYGGQSYQPQLQSLRRGVHVVVGTPGRLMDHIKRGTLQLGGLRYLVLDEADEMLRMGFIDDVEWILEQAPTNRQIALFSATLPPAVRRIAQKHLREPAEVTIEGRTSTASGIRQRYWVVSGLHKLDALTRILEVEPFDGMLVFTRTKVATEELARRLEARGFAVERLKAGKIDIIVATDVAARGLDVERISHVVNYDVPYDPESYIHRIGRTGRAGRSGEAILFVAPRERSMLRAIERATRQSIAPMQLPTVEDVQEQRAARFEERIRAALAAGEGEPYLALIERFESTHDVPAVEIAAALASMAQGRDAGRRKTERPPHAAAADDGLPAAVRPAGGKRRPADPEPPARPEGFRGRAQDAETAMETYRIEVGAVHGVQVGSIVGAIANEAGLDGKHIGRVVIREDHSLVDLPTGMPKEIFRHLRKVRVGGQKLQISRAAGGARERVRRDPTPQADGGRDTE